MLVLVGAVECYNPLLVIFTVKLETFRSNEDCGSSEKVVTTSWTQRNLFVFGDGNILRSSATMATRISK
jgi:hypothetical protein